MSDPADTHPLWLGLQPLVLASGSRTRLDLLASAGIPTEVIPASIDERAFAAPLEARGISPKAMAVSLAVEKALSVARQCPDRFVLGADQTLACDTTTLHKPVDRESAKEQLLFLSGKTHHLHSAVAIVRNNKTLARFVGSAKLTMRSLSDDMIERYLDAAGNSIYQSVGGYQLERTGVHLFNRISGDHSTILGLPMVQTLSTLRKLKLVVE
ncbi:MAG: Maf family protein [Beijerinckiaceae bacterium]